MTELKSDTVIVESPMSFTGATKRIWPLTEKSDNPNIRNFVLKPLVVTLLYFVYSIIFVWYIIFGIFLLPFRLIRRSHRKNKKRDLQHAELLEALANKK